MVSFFLCLSFKNLGTSTWMSFFQSLHQSWANFPNENCKLYKIYSLSPLFTILSSNKRRTTMLRLFCTSHILWLEVNWWDVIIWKISCSTGSTGSSPPAASMPHHIAQWIRLYKRNLVNRCIVYGKCTCSSITIIAAHRVLCCGASSLCRQCLTVHCFSSIR